MSTKESQKTLVISEAGVNHNGSLETAKELVHAAAKAGADVVKFQTFKAESLVTQSASKADYQLLSTESSESQFHMIKNLELNPDDHMQLIAECEAFKICFASTGFDKASVDFLIELGIDFLKIPSGEITNLPYLRHVGSKNIPIILSTGMATLEEVRQALDILTSSGLKKSEITVLHCNTEYPTPFEDVNLRAMISIKETLGVEVGYSDHTLGLEVPIAAVAMGATVIEKHFTLDRSMDGPDHAASLEPNELKEMVASIRNIEKALGSGIKKPSKSELKNLPVVRKSIVASRRIEAGEVFTEDNLTVKRPGSTISPMKWDELIGQKASRDYQPDDFISL
ncbi:N-acetylneuraminate synthase [Opitutales bacterium]|nr:N-acetylneuraminate synthase [Opitutales bacterium]